MSHGTNDSWWTKLTRPVLEFPIDLAILGFAVALATFALLQPEVRATPLAVVLGLPVALFAPGYAVVSFLFPEAGPPRPTGWGEPKRIRREGISLTERISLSFGVSLCLLPLLGLSLSLPELSFDPVYVLAIVVGFTLAVIVFGAIRRVNVPADDRFSVSIRGGASRIYGALFDDETGFDVVLNVLLALSVVVALSAVGYAFAAPQDGEHFSQLTLLNETDDGEFVTADASVSFTPGETKPMYISVTNHEGERVKYTVVAELQRVEQRPDGSARIVEQQERKRFEQRLPAGGSWRTQHEISPTMAGEDLRLVYLLYKGDPPSNPSINNADEHAYVWITVGANGSE
ncbi:DUF1616 domain-containing protein [Haladaptatus sp. DFWS20]|uniref:DUF1616 domain-containing protein n=1 Tax=Haladaptatus sp. DFWS20 TaxID=3403467 RepID=UPI003EB72229